MSERERIEAKLAELTGTPASIAEKLRVNGITGRPNEPEYCVIAKWIDAPVWKGDGIDEPSGYYVDCITTQGGPVILPPHLQIFITLFDSGEFSDLIS